MRDSPTLFNVVLLLLFLGGSGAGAAARPAVFLLPMAVLLPVGLVHLALREQSAMNTILLAGFLTSPLAASLPAEPRIRRPSA